MGAPDDGGKRRVRNQIRQQTLHDLLCLVTYVANPAAMRLAGAAGVVSARGTMAAGTQVEKSSAWSTDSGGQGY